MRALLIAIGNRLRCDDGVAHAVLESLACRDDVESRSLLQLTPELAEEIAGYDVVVLMDCDASASDLSIEPVNPEPASRIFTHVAAPAEIVGLSRALFGFKGRAFLCRIPAYDFSLKEGLRHRAKTLAREAAALLESLLKDEGVAGGGNFI